MYVDDEHHVHVVLQVHAPKLYHAAPDLTHRCIHLLSMDAHRTIPLDANFVVYEADDVREAFDIELRTVQHAMTLLHNYDPSTHLLAGVVMPSGDIIAHVVDRPKRKKRASSTRGTRSLSA